MDTLDGLEAMLLLASMFGAWHHWRNLAMLGVRCDGVTHWSDVLLCRMYRRHEYVLLGVKIALIGVAIWLLSHPAPSINSGLDLFGFLFFRCALIGIAIALDWESMRARSDRAALIRGKL